MRKIASPGELRSELENLLKLSQLDGVSRARMSSELTALARRVAVGDEHKDLVNKLESPGWEIWYDRHSEEIVGKYAPQKNYDSYVGVSFYGALDEVESGSGSVRYEMSYAEGSDHRGQIGGREKTGKVNSVAEMKKVLQDAVRLYEKAEKQKERETVR